ncbi:MAG: Trm112 family protein, partial [Balneolales bacterium]
MKASLLEKLCCPIDKHDLNIKIFTKHEEGEIHEALMTCPKCKRYYPVIYGIPIMTP